MLRLQLSTACAETTTQIRILINIKIHTTQSILDRASKPVNEVSKNESYVKGSGLAQFSDKLTNEIKSHEMNSTVKLRRWQLRIHLGAG